AVLLHPCGGLVVTGTRAEKPAAHAVGVRHISRRAAGPLAHRTPRAGVLRTLARLVEVAVPQIHGDADCAAGVPRRRLNPDLIEWTVAQNPAVADAVEGDAAGHAEIRQPGLLPRERGHLHHHLFGDVLNRAREVHFPLCELRLRLPRRSVE